MTGNTMEVNFIGESRVDRNIKVGQVRYTQEGMYVLIIKGKNKNTYDAVVLSNENGYTEPYDVNSQGLNADTITYTYPYVAKAKLEITK